MSQPQPIVNPNAPSNGAPVQLTPDKIIAYSAVSSIGSSFSNYGMEQFVTAKDIQLCKQDHPTLTHEQCACKLSGVMDHDPSLKDACYSGYQQGKATQAQQKHANDVLQYCYQQSRAQEQTQRHAWFVGCVNGIKGGSS